MSRRGMWAILVFSLLPVAAFAGTLPQNYTVQSHGYIWRADGSSATQGTGSIGSYPNITGTGTATATLSQVTTASVPTIPTASGTLPGSGSFIKVDAAGGASGGTINIEITVASTSLSSLGNFGFYFYDPVGGATDFTGINFFVANTAAYSKYFIFNGSNVANASFRIKGWNLMTWQRGDEGTTVGGMAFTDTSVRMRIQFVMVANKTVTLYFGDIVKGYYAKPQIMVWAADNGQNAYDMMYPYMDARGLPGSYMPTTDYLASPGGTQITAAELSTMQADGWTIVPHQTIGTALTSMSEADMRAEIAEVLAVHASYGWTFKDFYYPAGGAGNDLSNTVMASYGIRFGNNANASNHKTSRPLYGGIFNPYRMWSYTADGKTFASDVKPLIDHAIKYGGAVGILWHDGSGADEAEFKASMDYLYRLKEANIVDVVNYETFFNRLSNARKTR